ncbi:hypothetical protein DL769_010268 [Monosporascus sp. CRB-8-3]|nr:hypothetical protein DL769_010268 [Monosporascus sp. CRB-8-3]
MNNVGRAKGRCRVLGCSTTEPLGTAKRHCGICHFDLDVTKHFTYHHPASGIRRNNFLICYGCHRRACEEYDGYTVVPVTYGGVDKGGRRSNENEDTEVVVPEATVNGGDIFDAEYDLYDGGGDGPARRDDRAHGAALPLQADVSAQEHEQDVDFALLHTGSMDNSSTAPQGDGWSIFGSGGWAAIKATADRFRDAGPYSPGLIYGPIAKLDTEPSASAPLPSPIRNTAFSGSPSGSPATRDLSGTRYGKTVLGTGLEERRLDPLAPSFPSWEHHGVGTGLPNRFYGFRGNSRGHTRGDGSDENVGSALGNNVGGGPECGWHHLYPPSLQTSLWPSRHRSYPYYRTVGETHAAEAAAMSRYDNEDRPVYTEEAWLNLAIIADLNNGMRDSDREGCELLAIDEQGRVEEELGEQVHSQSLQGSLSTPSTSGALFPTSASHGGVLATAEGGQDDQGSRANQTAASERGNKPNNGGAQLFP